jgi:hypothetical protein
MPKTDQARDACNDAPFATAAGPPRFAVYDRLQATLIPLVPKMRIEAASSGLAAEDQKCQASAPPLTTYGQSNEAPATKASGRSSAPVGSTKTASACRSSSTCYRSPGEDIVIRRVKAKDRHGPDRRRSAVSVRRRGAPSGALSLSSITQTDDAKKATACRKTGWARVLSCSPGSQTARQTKAHLPWRAASGWHSVLGPYAVKRQAWRAASRVAPSCGQAITPTRFERRAGRNVPMIGIGGRLTTPPLPHHLA